MKWNQMLYQLDSVRRTLHQPAVVKHAEQKARGARFQCLATISVLILKKKRIGGSAMNP